MLTACLVLPKCLFYLQLTTACLAKEGGVDYLVSYKFIVIMNYNLSPVSKSLQNRLIYIANLISLSLLEPSHLFQYIFAVLCICVHSLARGIYHPIASSKGIHARQLPETLNF